MTTMLLNSSVSTHSANFTFLNSNATLTNSSSDATYSALPIAAKYTCYVFYGIVLLFGTLGNILVFYVIGYRKKRRNSGDVYMLSLASADFLASLAAPLVMLSDLITDFSGWFYGEMLCYVMPTISPITMCASAWTLVLISADRLRVISTPLMSNLLGRYLYGSIAFVWLSSVGMGIPYGLRVEFKEGMCQTTNHRFVADEHFVVFIGISVLCIWCIPNIVIIFVYFFTASALKANTFKHENSKAMEQRNKQNAKTVRMFVVVVIVFSLLTLPYAIFYFYVGYIVVYGTNAFSALHTTLNYVLFAASSANGCVNPLIYAKMHREVNDYVRMLVQRITRFHCKCYVKNSENTYAPSSAWSVSTAKTDQSSTI